GGAIFSSISMSTVPCATKCGTMVMMPSAAAMVFVGHLEFLSLRRKILRWARLSPRHRCKSSTQCHGISGRPSLSGVRKKRSGWPPMLAMCSGLIIVIVGARCIRRDSLSILIDCDKSRMCIHGADAIAHHECVAEDEHAEQLLDRVVLRFDLAHCPERSGRHPTVTAGALPL